MVLSPHSLAKMATSIGFWGCFLSKRMDFPASSQCMDFVVLDGTRGPKTKHVQVAKYLFSAHTCSNTQSPASFLLAGNKILNSVEGKNLKEKTEESVKIWITHIHPYPLFQSIGFCSKKQEFNLGIGLEEPRGEGDSSFISAVSRESQGGRLLAKIEGCPRFLGVGRSEAQWINDIYFT